MPASMPTSATRPGWSNVSAVSDDPPAFRPRPLKDWKTIPASRLKLPMMKAKKPI